MLVARVHQIDNLRESWKELSQGRPFCSPLWMESWAKQCCGTGSPFIVAVFEKDKVVGIAPFHTHRSRIGADRLEFLGTGKACSEYLGILVDPIVIEPVIEHLSQWMMESAVGVHGDENRWQRLDMESVTTEDLPSNLLCRKLEARGAQWVAGDAAKCWRINLRETQAQWLGRLNRSIRRKLRLLQNRAIQTGRAVYKIASTPTERLTTFQHLVRLHNERRNQLRESGCFEFPGFQEFLNQVNENPESSEVAKLSLVELDGVVVAAGLCFESPKGLFVYQSGITLPSKSKTDFVATNPGWLLNLFHIEYARSRRLQFIDYLRGDEPYKRQLGAVPNRVSFHMVTPPVTAAVVRQRIWALAQSAKALSKEVIDILPQL
ncbi:MAG TPA: hypothetical protein DDZ51_26545 [Planctomycetaceae bacterium]|nr:hypothetical protein [Planctomycetaceae bacterium]